jgi:hypothetical protein
MWEEFSNSVPKLTEQPPVPWPLPGLVSNAIKSSHARAAAVVEASTISSETSSLLSKEVMQPAKVKSIVRVSSIIIIIHLCV